MAPPADRTITAFRAAACATLLLLAGCRPGTVAETPRNSVLEGIHRAADGGIVALRPPTDGLTVLFFYSRDCPISNFHLPVLNGLVESHGEDRIRWVGACVDPGLAPEAHAQHARDYAIAFPVIADPSGTLARAVGATTTPEAVVFDARGQLVYRGRIDDHYAARGVKATSAQSHDLDDAVRAALAGRRPARREVAAVGCPLPEIIPEKEVAVTYADHVAPLLFRRCLECHREGAIAPFALETYDQARQRAGDIAAVTRSRFMPPSRRDPRFGQRVQHDILLADGEIDLLAAWAAGGAPEGDPERIPAKPEFSDGWALGPPDLVLEMPEPFTVPATGPDVHRCFVLPTGLEEDTFVSAVEYLPGNPSVVHHIISYVDTSGEAAKRDAEDAGPGYECFGGARAAISGILGGWGPGTLPERLPAGVARQLPAKADIVMQFHYHPNGREQTDRSRVGIHFAKTPVKQSYHWLKLVSGGFLIPAGESDFEMKVSRTIPKDLMVTMVFPHMHLLGKEMEVWVDRPDGTRVDLVRADPWDFAWQRFYDLERPLLVPRGSSFRLRSRYDNSSANHQNPARSAPVDVASGDRTNDEMCLAVLGVVRVEEDLTEPGAREEDDFLSAEWKPEEVRPWRIWTSPGIAAATLSEEGSVVRVALPPGTQAVDRWKVQVKHLARVERGKTHELTVRLKADAPRDVVCGVLQNHHPFSRLSEFAKFHLSDEWQDCHLTFTADSDEPDAQIVLAAAGSRVAFEIGGMTFTKAAPMAAEDAAGGSR